MSVDTRKDAEANASVDAHRHAYNAAFHELGLGWYWDCEAYRNVLCKDGEKAQICSYLKSHQPHLLRAYDAEFLAEVIQATQARLYDALHATSGGLVPSANWAELHKRQIGA